jgi:hypothetical protein
MHPAIRESSILFMTISNFVTGWLLGMLFVFVAPLAIAHLFGRRYIAEHTHKDHYDGEG